MTKLEQLAALVAKQGAAVRAASAKSAGDVVVADVPSTLDAEILAEAHNALPALVACAKVLARINARRLAGRHTTLAADRTAMGAALAGLIA